MRAFFLIITIFALNGSMPTWAVEWLGDIASAQERARVENKVVMVNFGASDWCKWCIYLQREVYDTPEFAAFANEKLVLVDIDFPKYKMIAHLQKLGNAQLARTYHVYSYPTILVLAADGTQLGRFGYVHGGPRRFIEELRSKAKMGKETPATPAPPEPEPMPRPKPVTFTLPLPPPPIHYGPLTLKGISGPENHRLALINNASLYKGESAKVRSEDREVVVVCKEIGESSVVLLCEGKQIELKLRQQ